jgi:hypothetical protein
MQTTSIIKIVLVLFGVTITSFAWGNGSTAKQLQLTLNPEKTIVLKAAGSKALVFTQTNRALNIKVDRSLSKHLKSAEEIALIFPDPITQLNSQLFVAMVREPSRSTQGAGFCGAGLEDYLLLIEVTSKKISLLDTLLLQSCLTSKELASDQGNDPLKAMRIDPNKKSLTYKMLGEEVEKVTTVTGRKFQTN